MVSTTKDFEELLGCLIRHGVRFVVVGAHALIVPLIGKAALIKNKSASGRPQDLADLELLQNTNH